MKPVTVKECIVDNQKVFGITCDKKWFFYAYETKEQAENIAKSFTTQITIDVNIQNPKPMKIPTITK